MFFFAISYLWFYNHKKSILNIKNVYIVFDAQYIIIRSIIIHYIIIIY